MGVVLSAPEFKSLSRGLQERRVHNTLHNNYFARGKNRLGIRLKIEQEKMAH